MNRPTPDPSQEGSTLSSPPGFREATGSGSPDAGEVRAVLSQQELDALRALSTPTVSNAVELFNLRPRNHGFMSAEIRCLFPDLGALVGHAMTARFAANQPGTQPASRYEFWKRLLEIPEPRVVVLEDLDHPPGVGAYFGEVQTNIHRRLGCIGVVTNGHVRDLDEVHALGFHYFAGGVCVSHAYVHMVDFGLPVKLGGLWVKPGDLIHADQHGVVTIPTDIAPKIAEAVAKVEADERQIIGVCQSKDFTADKLKALYQKIRPGTY